MAEVKIKIIKSKNKNVKQTKQKTLQNQTKAETGLKT